MRPVAGVLLDRTAVVLGDLDHLGEEQIQHAEHSLLFLRRFGSARRKTADVDEHDREPQAAALTDHQILVVGHNAAGLHAWPCAELVEHGNDASNLALPVTAIERVVVHLTITCASPKQSAETPLHAAAQRFQRAAASRL
jgi:hypothetical protein